MITTAPSKNCQNMTDYHNCRYMPFIFDGMGLIIVIITTTLRLQAFCAGLPFNQRWTCVFSYVRMTFFGHVTLTGWPTQTWPRRSEDVLEQQTQSL